MLLCGEWKDENHCSFWLLFLSPSFAPSQSRIQISKTISLTTISISALILGMEPCLLEHLVTILKLAV